MNTYLAITLSLVILTGTAQAQVQYDQGITQISSELALAIGTKPQIATALDFRSLDGKTTELGKLFALDVFEAALSASTNTRWIDREKRDFIIQENQLSADRLMDPVTQKQLQKLPGISVIITGKITELGESAKVQARAIEIETK